MAETFRRTKLEKFIKRLEARAIVHKDASWGSHGYGRYEAIHEVISELKQEFNLKEENLFSNEPSNVPQQNKTTPFSKEPIEERIKALREEQK